MSELLNSINAEQTLGVKESPSGFLTLSLYPTADDEDRIPEQRQQITVTPDEARWFVLTLQDHFRRKEGPR